MLVSKLDTHTPTAERYTPRLQSQGLQTDREGHAAPMLTILLIVLVVLLLTGGIGYGYRGRGRA